MHTNYSENIDIDSTLGFFFLVDVDNVADISKVHASDMSAKTAHIHKVQRSKINININNKPPLNPKMSNYITCTNQCSFLCNILHYSLISELLGPIFPLSLH
jgi:hypothetical protein